MLKRILKLFVLSAVIFMVGAPTAFAAEDDIGPNDSITPNIYRLYNSETGEHLYTPNDAERVALVDGGWNYEGIGWKSPETGNPVYRLFSAAAGEHLYTVDENEVETLVNSGAWVLDFDGEPIFYSNSRPNERGTVPVYRLYNPTTGRHHLTTDLNEYNLLGEQGWNQEGAVLFGISDENLGAHIYF